MSNRNQYSLGIKATLITVIVTLIVILNCYEFRDNNLGCNMKIGYRYAFSIIICNFKKAVAIANHKCHNHNDNHNVNVESE